MFAPFLSAEELENPSSNHFDFRFKSTGSPQVQSLRLPAVN